MGQHRFDRVPPDKRAQRYAKRVQPRIQTCDTCEMRDGMEVYWSFHHYGMDELLNEFGVPESLHRDVARRLECPCGVELDLSGRARS